MGTSRAAYGRPPAFASFSQQGVGAVLVGNSTFYTRRTEQLAAVPVIGFLSSGTQARLTLTPFGQGLKEARPWLLRPRRHGQSISI
jgi:hypothetical protein